MAKFFAVPFAATGDKSVTPNATAVDGSISYTQGWPAAYQLPDTDPNYRPVGRQEMNGVLNDITGAIAEIQTLGFAEWVTVTGLVQPYALNAVVRHNGIVWQSLIVNNSDEPGVGAGATSWRDKSAMTPLHGQQRFTSNGSFTVPDGITTIYVSGVAGGGGGGGTLNIGATGNVSAGGGGGGAGQSTQDQAFTVTPGQVIPITIGGGGGGGGIASGGTPGGNTVIGSLLTLVGGGGGGPGSAGVSSANWAGGAGGAGFPGGGESSDGTAAYSGTSGIGGTSPFGGGGSPRRGAANSSLQGIPAGGFGGGGGGAGGAYSGTATSSGNSGGAGSSGMVLIKW